MIRGSKKLLIISVGALGLAGLLLAAPIVGPRLKDRLLATETTAGHATTIAYVVADGFGTLRIDPGVVKRLPIITGSVQPASEPVTLELSGTLMLDSDHLAHVHTRFPGEVVAVGKRESDGRPIAFGMPVQKGQLLAEIWSRDLGEKRSELVDSLSHLWLDEETLAKLLHLAQSGAVPDRTVREAQRQVESDRITVARVERTMQAWRLGDDEIQDVRAEAERLRKEHSRNHRAQVADWARVGVRSPIDGVVMERNFSLGDLVETDDDLFVVASMSRLRVVAHAYEEDLPALDALPADRRSWSLAVTADPAIAPQAGQFEHIGRIIDPSQHTALVMGWVDNAQGRLRVGQFITAKVELPAGRDEVAVPAAALVDDGSRPMVIVQPDPREPVFSLRQVAVTRRTQQQVFINGKPTAEQGQCGARPLAPGELVVVSGVVQLASSFRDLPPTVAAGK